MKKKMYRNNVEIVDLSSDFKGIASVDGKKCFVENTVVGDIVDINIVEQKQKYSVASVVKFVNKSTYRKNEIDCDIKCEYFGKCGGCPLYFYNEDYYYSVKKEKLAKNIRNSGYDFDSSKIRNFKVGIGKRRRINLKYRNVFGFYGENSIDIIKIDSCINITKNLNKVVELLKNMKFSNLESVDVFDTEIIVNINFIFNNEPKIEEFKQLDIFKNKNFVVFYTYKDKEKYVPIVGNSDDIKINLGGFELILPQNCFLQATRESQDFMIDVIKNEVLALNKDSIKIADLYCGVGTYSFPLSKITKSRIYSFEGNFNMVENMKKNIIANKIKNIFPVQQDLFNQPLQKSELDEFDIIIINPPRNGAENQCKNIVKSTTKKVIYVSCDPCSLARDLRLFYDNNFELEKVILVDQFYLSKHLESLIVLSTHNQYYI